MSYRQPAHTRSLRHSPQGYSLIELLIGFTVAIILLMVLFQTFQANTQLARTQIDVADMQQSQRVIQHEMVRVIRMVGRGGLAHMVDLGNGNRYLPALNVQDNVAANQTIGSGTTPVIEEGTDVLTVRGVINTPVYQLNFADPTILTLLDATNTPTTNASLAISGQIVISDPSPTGIPQDLTPLCDADDSSAAMVVVSPIDESIYAVVEVGDVTCGANQATIDFAVSGGTYTDQYRTLYNSGTGANPILPSGLTNAAYAGLVEEYRYYVREPEPDTTPAPTLSVARMFPGTDVAHLNNNTNLTLDLADNIMDLQIALGYDSSLGAAPSDQNGDGFTNEDDIVVTETVDGRDDDWLFNSDQDDPNAAPFIPPWDNDPGSGTPFQPALYYVRLSTLARVHVPDRTYDSLQIEAIENRDVDPLNSLDERRYRRQLMQTTIDLRNL